MPSLVTRVRSEMFRDISLTVGGVTSLEESLSLLVQPELMEGDNKVSCDACDTRRDSHRYEPILSSLITDSHLL